MDEAPELVATLAAPAAPVADQVSATPEVPAPVARTTVTSREPEPEPEREPPAETPAAPPVSRPRDVAVVGAAIKLPTASDLTAFAELLLEGRDTVRPLPEGRWDAAAGPVPNASFLDSVDEFDPAPFRISAREAP